MPGRSGSTDLMRYKHQGQESDPEIYGESNSYAYKYRMSDPRTVRMWSPDPLASKYPFYSPYAFSGNRLIDAIELEGLEPIGAAKENGEPVHEQGYNINIGGTGGTDIPVYQRGEGGSLAIEQSGLEALGNAGYQINPVRQGAGSNRFGSTQMSTDPTQSMFLMVGGTTVTSDAPLKNQFSMVEIVPPQQVQVGQNVQQVQNNGQQPIGVFANTLTGATTRGAVPTSVTFSDMRFSIDTEINNLMASSPAGTTRVINTVTIPMNTNLYSTSEMTRIQNMLNPVGQNYNIVLTPSNSLDPQFYYNGGTATFTDTRNVVTPVMAPTTTGVTITDLIQR